MDMVIWLYQMTFLLKPLVFTYLWTWTLPEDKTKLIFSNVVALAHADIFPYANL